MTITYEELQNNLDQYLLTASEDKDGHIISELTNVRKEKLDIVDLLVGILPQEASLVDGVDERLKNV